MNAATCETGKVIYANPAQAQRVGRAHRRNRKRRTQAVGLRSYRCAFCGGWHLTHEERRR